MNSIIFISFTDVNMMSITVVYMHRNIPLLFQIRQYSEFDTGHANSIIHLDIPNLALFQIYHFQIRCGICWYYLCFTVGAFFEHIYSNFRICISVRVFNGSLRHMDAYLFTGSSVAFAKTRQQFPGLRYRCLHLNRNIREIFIFISHVNSLVGILS